jgi:5'-3' exonuclease
MGIKDINVALRKYTPEAFMSVPISQFSGKAIGIDASLWMFKAKSSALKDIVRSMKDPLQDIDQNVIIKSMISQFYGFMSKICNVNITPVWIFDGKTHPAKIAVERRKKAKKISIQDERERLRKMDLLERKPEIDKFINSLLNCFCFTQAEEDSIKMEIQNLGMPMFIAPYDAEIFASKLSKNKLIIGVWTTDTDTYASGSMITFLGFSNGSSSRKIMVDIVLVSTILYSLDITQDQFRDFCILHECDFNIRIPGMGPITIKKKMDMYKWDLDCFMKSEPEKEWRLLNVQECRKIFDGPDVEDITIKDMYIDRKKWKDHMMTKTFNIQIPDNPKIVRLI